jgi:hypothetical protein
VDESAERLAEGIERALPGWVVGCVDRLLVAYQGSAPPEVLARAAAAGEEAARDVGAEVRRLLATDVDEQWTNPLHIVRAAVRFPTAVLQEAGVPGIERDAFDETHFPDDVYGLTPMSFADVDDELQELGIVWGATKARAHLERRRAEGLR